MTVNKSLFVWSVADLTGSPSTVGSTFTVTGAPDLMTFSDGAGSQDQIPSDFNPVDNDQILRGILDGTEVDDVFEFEVAYQVTDGTDTFLVYRIDNGSTDAFVSEQALVSGTTYTVTSVDVSVNNSGGGTLATPYYDDFADGVVEGTGGDDVITAASGYTDLDGEQVDGGDGQGTGGNDDTIVGGTGSDTISAGAGADVVYGDHSPQTALAADQTDFVVDGYFKGENFHLDSDHFNSDGATVFTVDTGPTSIRFVDSDSTLDSDGLGAANEVIDPNEAGLVEIDGQLYSYVADFQQSFDGSDGNEYTFIVVDVDLNGDGNVNGVSLPDVDPHFEDGQILLPVGTTPPPGVTLTSQGPGVSTTLITQGGTDYTTLDGYDASGSTYDDVIDGGAGNDTLIGGLGDDTIDGGDGADLIVGDDNSAFFATDPDSLIWTPPDGVSFSYASGSNLGNGVAGGGNHAADVASTEVSDLQLFFPTGDLDITSGDTIGFSFVDETGRTIIVQDATVQQSAFSTGADDTGVVSAQGADQFGNQIAVLLKLTNNNGSASSPINAGDGFFDNDTGGGITNGTDVTLSPANAASAYSGDGNDTLRGGAGADTLLGGEGDDFLEGGAGGDVIDGGDGTDWASYESSDAAVTVSLDAAQSPNQTGGIEADGGHATGDSLTGIENLRGSDFDDLLEGDGGVNIIEGGDGDDVLYGHLGDDTIEGGTGADTIDGGWNNDTLDGGEGADLIFGGRGDDTLTGGDGNDDLQAGQGNDVLDGGVGDDIINSGRGDDTMTGGDGNDTFLYQTVNGNPSGNDLITDFGAGETGPTNDGDQTNNDFVDLSAFYTQAAVDAFNAATGSNIAHEITLLRADQQDGVLDGNVFGIDLTGTATDLSDINLTIQNAGTAVNPFTLTFDNTNVACFARRTHIMTRNGEVPIEELKVGDMVLTADHGYKPIRWIGSQAVLASGKLAPIQISRGALGNHRDLYVSQQHRMLLSGWWSELMFGEAEVLAASKSLVNDDTIWKVEGGEVEYFHMLFDTHEIIFAEGIPSESYHPGEQGWDGLCDAARAEILGLFPQLAGGRFSAYGPTARPVLKACETRLASDFLKDTKDALPRMKGAARLA